MLHVLFLILKIIGIILAVLLGLILLLLLLVLFVPVRYRAYGIKKGGECRAEAKLSWLLHLISIPISYQNGELSARLRILGFPVLNLLEEEKEDGEEELRKEKPGKEKNGKETSEKATPETVSTPEEAIWEEKKRSSETRQTQKEENQTGEPQQIPAAQPDLEEESGEEKDGAVSRFFRFLRAVWGFLKGILQKLKNLKCTFRRFCGKMKRMAERYREIKDFALDERTKAAVSLVWKQAGILARQALPRKIRGELHFGTDDPALTGQILGAIGIFYPLFMDNVKVNPDFEQMVLEGELFFRGRLRLVTLARIAWRLFRDKNVRYVYRKLNRA
ncbi:hypothetical protein B5E77_02790 [Lachnoclostridium sp. An131]|uniref:DUF2953 domain-containing protein n=1 Tax=Lachnoclostridium sp. An131 TaxID=1965555 RepID=UPI000B399B30|nr:DUF2953 domain-containing protein [Lachnoclostridium sp. An131]OUQ28242.1 hypothetical protein B5E77_02790 [Lachnoclostridium sp. An131]